MAAKKKAQANDPDCGIECIVRNAAGEVQYYQTLCAYYERDAFAKVDERNM